MEISKNLIELEADFEITGVNVDEQIRYGSIQKW